MKKYIIAAALVLTTGVTALSIAKSLQAKTLSTVTVDSTDHLLHKGFSAQKNDISSAD